ncbi:GNAT family N-acetyltransferase [Microbulbifer celer]|uniref:GNAT family N-acetyltransferase n=1 Tax=Microbulbifer celer TaxID=435905 RepID=A0ABW3UB10_9GAMM|nr:GNAT family N-acetyltransferase [Microbulbifer celer]UFN56895.1 GNAT family N-acetyltransferase [Microbulbifer celer]
MTTLIEPQTERLQLRQWRNKDREPFAAMNADPRVMEFFPALLSREESDAAIDRQITHIEKYGWGFWAVERLEDHQFIGFVGIKNVGDELPFAPAVEIGWRLAVDFWGKGYATEAACASLQIGFEQLKLKEIVSFTALNNMRSRSVMEKIGMVDTCKTFLHPSLSDEHPLQEHCLYQLFRDR